MADASDETSDADEAEVFRGVLPVAPAATKKQQGKKRKNSTSNSSVSAFLYGGGGGASSRNQSARSITEPSIDAEAEEALMASMGLPTSLKPHTADVVGDSYEVWSSDPSRALGQTGIAAAEEEVQDHEDDKAHFEKMARATNRAEADGSRA